MTVGGRRPGSCRSVGCVDTKVESGPVEWTTGGMGLSGGEGGVGVGSITDYPSESRSES